MSNRQNLGEFTTVKNKDIKNNLQAKDLIVGFVLLDGDVTPLAFTEKEFNRPKKRAEDNKEDIPVLGAKPPTHEDLKNAEDRLKNCLERNANTQKELDFYKNRGFFARLFNSQPCEDGSCDDSGKTPENP
jgi:hypothetical protein